VSERSILVFVSSVYFFKRRRGPALDHVGRRRRRRRRRRRKVYSRLTQ